jgi:hypothetical protein
VGGVLAGISGIACQNGSRVAAADENADDALMVN